MEGIERDVPVDLDNGLVNLQIKQNLSENLDEKGMLRKLLEKYFHMIDNLERLDILKENVCDYEDAFKNLLSFSKTPFMEETSWRVSDN